MAVGLSLLGAIVFGCADFWGGLATRRSGRTAAVVVVTQLAGLLALFVEAPLVGSSTLHATDLLWGAAAGLCGMVGLLCFYRALAVGTMSIVSPITAVVSAIVPVVAGLLLGDRPEALAWVGIAIGIGAIVLFGGVPHPHGSSGAAVLGAVLGGLGFGTFFVLLSQSGDGAGLWPLVAARSVSGAVLVLGALVLHQPLRLARDPLRIAIAAGVADVSANALYLVSTHYGLLPVVGVVIAFYPASTLVLARVVLHERLEPLHWAALGLAGAAVVLIALG
jgi:drug/metabolite transporter (DMT)-like permease